MRLFVLIFSFSTLFGAVEESIVSDVAVLYEQVEAKKYSTEHYLEIKRRLSQKAEFLRVATFNVLFDFYDDTLPEEYRWPQRKNRVVEMILHLKPDVLGVQEVYPHLLNDLRKGLNGYAFFGEAQKGGEINGIFYNAGRLTLIDSRFQDPLNLVTLRDNATGKVFAFCNTHLAFVKIDKRERQAAQVHKIISEFLREERVEVPPLILTGDMNTFPNIPTLKKLPFLDGNRIETLLKGQILLDARECALLGHLGPLSTFSNGENDIAPFKGRGTPGVFLDHIFVTKNIAVLAHAVEPGLVDGLYASDHLPVFADIILQ